MIQSSNRNKGYTLIELMVVVGIIALLLGLSLNGIYNLIQWNKLNTAAALLSSELKNTQSRAFYEGVWYKIEFQPTYERYKIFKETELERKVQLENIDLFHTNFTDNRVRFLPSGSPSMGGTVTLKNKRGKVLYVIMTPVTARVRVSPDPPENW